jgi:hypothetical protein
MCVKGGAISRRSRVNHFFSIREVFVPIHGRGVGDARFIRNVGIVRLHDDIHEKGPRVELAINGPFLADRWNHVVQHFFWNVRVPRFDDPCLDQVTHEALV